MRHGDLRQGIEVLITAGGSGIGRAIAECFDSEGARVHVCDVVEDCLQELRRERPGIRGTIADVGDPEQVAVLFESALSHLGGLDVLVNNAGIAGPTATALAEAFAGA